MESTTVKTAWHSELEAARRSGGVYEPSPYSTLNEKFGILANEPLTAGQFPDIQYLAIGRGGHVNVVGTNGASLTDSLQHRVTDACLFEHLPWRLRETDNDITAAERETYKMRRLETHGGIEYFAYYLKKLDMSSSATTIKIETTIDGTTTSQDYTPSTQQLSPVPVSMTNGEVNESTGRHLTVSSQVSESISNTDISEILQAAEIIYGSRQYAEITEMAVCSGFEKAIQSTDGGQTVNYDEVQTAQCASFIGSDYSLRYQNSEITLDFTIGNSVPYLT
ncbi:virion structural protein [Vibrio phage BONAISHI]|nr:virion structural protein [Vibrio phage BONAISHI]